ncbi:MAG: hypothetical protein ACLFUF_02835 [Opitutales bacterium]
MSQTTKKDAIGFPPPLLGEAPLRLSLIGEGSGWIALNKPSGIGMREHPWDIGVPHLDGALNRQLQSGKPELLAKQAELFGSVYYLDPGIAGVALFATTRAALAEWRNHFGGGGLRFRFRFVSADDSGPDTRECDAPLLPHRSKPRMVPSTAKGKKTRTVFQRLASSESGWSLWEGVAEHLRPHQLRVHAALAGIPVLGDAAYQGPVAPLLRELMPGKRSSGLRLPVFRGPAIYLREVAVVKEGLEGPDAVTAPADKEMTTLLKRMGWSEVW